jgi:rare lipoprotein A (peptidoglycan hydrolase)
MENDVRKPRRTMKGLEPATMRTHLRHALVAAAAAALLLLPAPAMASPTPAPAGPAVNSASATDAPTYRALELQRSIDDVQGELAGIDSRIAVTSTHVQQQTTALDTANANLRTVQGVYNDRVVAIYQSGDYDMFSILLDSDSFTDLVARLELMTRILEADRSTLEEMAIVAAQAQYQAGQLDMLRAREATLRQLRNERATSLTAAQTEQQTLTATLTPQSLTLVQSVAAAAAKYRASWRAASVPAGTVAKRVAARVSPYAVRYTSSKLHYAAYRATGVKSVAVASWYGSDFDGHETASGELFNSTDFTCADDLLPIGTWVALTRTDPVTKITRRVVVVVNDRGPYVDGQNMQVTQAVADALGITDLGVATVDTEVVKPVTP